jgi:hypothetical protein
MAMNKTGLTREEADQHLLASTDPKQGPAEVLLGGLINSRLASGIFAIRSGIGLLSSMLEHDEFPCDQHERMTKEMTSVLMDELRGVEGNMIKALQELGWQMNVCDCDYCQQKDREHKAPYN